MRADAQRNRARLLDVAERVFIERGTEASTEDVAKAAGVGVGTVFRHFPTKAALVEAVYRAMLTRLATDVEKVSGDGDGLVKIFTLLVDRATVKKTLADALAAMNVDVATEGPPVLRDLLADML